MPSFVYVLITRNKSGRARTYVGWTLDLERRLAEHNGVGTKGAKSTRGQAWSLIYAEKHRTRRKRHGPRICPEAGPRLPGGAAVALKALFWQTPRQGKRMIFEQIATGGCQSYLLGCGETHAGILIDPNLKQMDHYMGLAARDGLRIRYVLDTHTHADHFSAAKDLGRALKARVVTHRLSPAPYADFRLCDGEILRVGEMRLTALHTPGHTRDSMCMVAEDRVFTGDTLLIGGTGRTDLPTGDPEALHDSLFNRLLKLDPALKVFPAHDYKGRSHSTIGEEIAGNPRLQKRERGAFVDMMRASIWKPPPI